MSTNFYWHFERPKVGKKILLPTGKLVDYVDSAEPNYHLGKRSSAGLYCWDCKGTLCMDGPYMVHTGRSKWSSVCLTCGKGSSSNTPTRFERALDLPRQTFSRGVASCCSFTWAHDPEEARKALVARKNEILVENEYQETFTGEAFLLMLEKDCPIISTDSVGTRFS